jgi:hypothetical protein
MVTPYSKKFENNVHASKAPHATISNVGLGRTLEEGSH